MKVIVSHDVDHLFLKEHLFDGVLLKYGVRAVFEWMNGVLSFEDFRLRLGDIFHSRWHHVDDLMDFDEQMGIPSTFFFGMRRGLGMNYTVRSVEPVVKRVQKRGFASGVHGNEAERKDVIHYEYDAFKKIVGHGDFGIRIHYLRMNTDTLKHLGSAGYRYDSSEKAGQNPYKKEDIWEFPLHIMDSDEFYNGKSWQRQKTEQILEKTMAKIVTFEGENQPYLNLLFHDRYFCPAYRDYKNWYKKVIEYLKGKGYSFIDFGDAIKDLTEKQPA